MRSATIYRATPATLGLVMTASLLAVALVAPFVGGISDLFGRKRLIVGACFALAVPTLLIALSPDLAALVACRFAQGLLFPFIFAVAVAYFGDECRGESGVRAASAYAVGTILGGFLGRFAAGVVTEFAGWRAGFAVSASSPSPAQSCWPGRWARSPPASPASRTHRDEVAFRRHQPASTIAQARVTTPIPANPARQPANSVTTPAANRPRKPPRIVPTA